MGNLIATTVSAFSHPGSLVSYGTGSDPTKKAEGKQIITNQAMFACTLPGHGTNPVTASGKAKVNGTKVCRMGDTAGGPCGAAIVSTGTSKTFSD